MKEKSIDTREIKLRQEEIEFCKERGESVPWHNDGVGLSCIVAEEEGA